MSKKRLPEIPIDPPTEYFTAVGEVAVRWARLEYQLGALARVGFKLGKDEQRSLILGMNMTVLAGVLRAIAQGWLKDKKLARKLKEFADDIDQPPQETPRLCARSLRSLARRARSNGSCST